MQDKKKEKKRRRELLNESLRESLSTKTFLPRLAPSSKPMAVLNIID